MISARRRGVNGTRTSVTSKALPWPLHGSTNSRRTSPTCGDEIELGLGSAIAGN